MPDNLTRVALKTWGIVTQKGIIVEKFPFGKKIYLQ